jgi:glycosyltransferase involved in cell wall biosynthesis
LSTLHASTSAAENAARGKSGEVRVLHIIVGLEIGGAERNLARLVAGTGEAGRFRHEVVSLTSVGTIGADLLRSGIPVDALGMKRAIDVPAAFFRLRSLIGNRRPDIVQTWMYHADLIGGLAARSAGVRKVVWGVRSTAMMPGTSRSTRLLRRILAVLSSRLPAAIVCAAEASRRAHAAAGYDDSKMVVIANGVDVDAPTASHASRLQLRQECGWEGNVLVVGCVGRFNPYKDYRTFVSAAGMVCRDDPRSRFVLIGRGLDSGNEDLIGWIRATGHPDRFSLLGERRDVPSLLAGLDVFCLSSRSEGFPNVVAEAMAARVPCVVTDAGDAALIVGDTGTAVPICDPAALARALEECLALDESARAALGDRARGQVTSRFSLASSHARFVALYEGLMGQGGFAERTAAA